jgi:hypothetical protein
MGGSAAPSTRAEAYLWTTHTPYGAAGEVPIRDRRVPLPHRDGRRPGRRGLRPGRHRPTTVTARRRPADGRTATVATHENGVRPLLGRITDLKRSTGS